MGCLQKAQKYIMQEDNINAREETKPKANSTRDE